MLAVLCRRWQTRVKGRDWYDFVWFVAKGVPLDLGHLAARMRQSGHLDDSGTLTESQFHRLLAERIRDLDTASARRDVAPFLRDADATAVWSREFFLDVGSRIRIGGGGNEPPAPANPGPA